jgi:hypothetical protein
MILGFKNTFVPAIVAGTKLHTIRRGKNWREGMSIQFYQNARQKTMKKFREDGKALVVQVIKVSRPERYLGPPREPVIIVDGRQLTPLECHELAHRDGFADLDELLRFICQLHSLPFEGQLIHWTDLRY